MNDNESEQYMKSYLYHMMEVRDLLTECVKYLSYVVIGIGLLIATVLIKC